LKNMGGRCGSILIPLEEYERKRTGTNVIYWRYVGMARLYYMGFLKGPPGDWRLR